jgi:UTP--glucose-1-phosphate uridylyltransferase
MSTRKIRKAVFPVGGMGTRFLPATKATAKEMMPVVDKPLIQYAVEEAIEAGCDQLIFITGRGKRAIADHFDVSYELEMELQMRGKTDSLEQIRKLIPGHVTACYIRQAKPLGLGHAVLCARAVVGEEPFAILLADDLIDGEQNKSCMAQMVDVFERYQTSVLGVQQVDPKETDKYGIVTTKPMAERVSRIAGIVEKPKPEEAPSTLGVVGRYILTPRIFELLEKTGYGAGDEIQLTDAIAQLLKQESVLAYEFQGRRYDCGNKLGYLEATVAYALKHPDLKEDFEAYLSSIAGDISSRRAVG